ncbi:hypothetical protein PV08_06659 [Exophiala spinifera]|uniref:Enoyl reductase (ER) domain-containing protein n=1 Tax=Exophiala spinifera TaxID=91928 RepID=A0A0D2B4L9_9EURO|nr:uncharacterized protein PV08_06659 [Exophiala spinifera]KIW13878.1 hypothetical protein PV08_06659 [Exophiala spinifera]
MKAVVYRGKKAVVEDRPVPKLRDDYLLIKVNAVALNPTDWKHVENQMPAEGGIIGCDFSGTVEEVGSAVTKPWSKGDKIMGVAHGGNYVQPEDGAFAEYIVAKGDVQMKKPDRLTFEQAATVPLGSVTVGQGLYQKALELNLPTDPVKTKEYVLIYGGSTATGSLGIQYAKLSGYDVITTCSPRNFDYVKSLGAVEAFDYNDPDAPKKIREFTGNKLRYAWDTVAEGKSPQFCADALSDSLSQVGSCAYGATLPVKFPRDDVKATSTLMYSIFGEAFDFAGTKIPALPEDFEFAKKFTSITEKLLAEGKLKTHAEEVRGGGLDAVPQGLEDLKAGKVSGKKLVYKI